MPSSMLTTEQATKLRAIVSRDLRFLNRLCDRMQRLQFPPADPLYAAATKARNSLQELHVEAHYAACKSGVGR
jgi:hypothetical protein